MAKKRKVQTWTDKMLEELAKEKGPVATAVAILQEFIAKSTMPADAFVRQFFNFSRCIWDSNYEDSWLSLLEQSVAMDQTGRGPAHYAVMCFLSEREMLLALRLYAMYYPQPGWDGRQILAQFCGVHAGRETWVYRLPHNTYVLLAPN